MSSPPEAAPRLGGAFARWNRALPTMGTLALAALLLAIATGVALAAGYDVARPVDSLALLELTSPAGRWVRALHAWSSHLLVVLALLHAVEHLANGTDARPAPAAWLRVVGAIPFLLGLALSGFMLKGDAEGQLARQLLAGLLERLPALGAALSAVLLGAGEELQLVYVHHLATLTLVVLVVAVEHGRRLWPSAGAALGPLAAALALAWLWPPGLHDGVEPVVKGPWLFLGLQELLHWLSRPGLAWPLLLAPLALLALLPRLREPARRRALLALGALLAVFVALTLFAALFRGAGWELTAPWRGGGPTSRLPVPAFAPLGAARLDEQRLRPVLERREGCVACHAEVTGLGKSHDPQAIGCASCHLGDPLAADAGRAHAGMVRVPGNLDTAALTCGRCHEAVLARVQGSLMATVRGMISVDRWAFGEQPTQDAPHGVRDLGASPADTHLRQLCVTCHLGTIRERSEAAAAGAPSGPGELPPAGLQLARGGGCAACHTAWPRQRDWSAERPERFTHPDVTQQVEDGRCFGCHSRSGRISLSYAGFWESGLAEEELKALPPGSWRRLADGRLVQRAPADAHQQKGMACIDCHTAQETMGDGGAHLHEDAATRVRCETCHRTRPARSVAREALPPEAEAIVRLRPAAQALRRFLLEDRTGEPLTNAAPLPDGTVELRTKLSGARLVARPPSARCAAPQGHERLSCRACHEAWVAQCVGCHTQWDAQAIRRDHLTGREERGAWVEYDVAPRIGPAALGVVVREGCESIVPFAPGMVMTLNGPGVPAPDPLPASAAALQAPGTRFLRAWAPSVPHTTSRAGLSCKACHQDPQVLGYGRGALSLVEAGGRWRWRFEPAYEAARQDGRPADAWIGFLDPAPGLATRSNARSLTPEEQRRVLDPGACMGCHDPETPKGAALYARWPAARAKPGPRCRVPAP